MLDLTPLDFLSKGAAERGDEPALVQEGRSWTWAELYGEVLETAAGLAKRGVGPGARMALIASDYSEFFRLLFAVWAAGGTAAPVNTSLPASHRRVILDRLRPHLCIYGAGESSLDEGGRPALRLAEEDPRERGAATFHRPDPAADAIIMFTSGTTGVPKGVRNSHGAVAANASLTAARLGIRPDDRLMINTPAYYTSAIIHLLTMFSRGAGLAASPGFHFGENLLELMVRFDCSGFGGAPVHLSRLAAAAGEAPAPPRLRFLMSSGDHLPVQVIDRVRKRFPEISLHCVYGLTEVAGRLCLLPPERLEEKKGSVGRPLKGMTVRVLDEDTLEPRGPGEVGEVYVKGPLLTGGYFEDEASSRDLHTPVGFRTGDYGYLDQDGFLYLRGRRDDIFKSGGEKVSALMIQEVLATHTDFADLAVVPIEDEVLGRVPGVYYVPGNNGGLDKRSLMRRLKTLLPANHVPSRFIPVDRIPRTGSGKVIRRELPATF
ncbi:MAG: class I adenylate-forming enzyme family protein [Thermodesulfobacteriota bacterium]